MGEKLWREEPKPEARRAEGGVLGEGVASPLFTS